MKEVYQCLVYERSVCMVTNVASGSAITRLIYQGRLAAMRHCVSSAVTLQWYTLGALGNFEVTSGVCSSATTGTPWSCKHKQTNKQI